ncbi:MAG TPA: hypothetical protein PKY59_22620 [Pyrinomonadaceae bacterium]|nr:hypothetical protein [Pyrinomonadaceae bacterium]
MNRIFTLIGFVFLTAICFNISAQQSAPAGAGDKDLRDTGIRTRSIDLERVDRDAHKTDKSKTNKKDAQAEDRLAIKYAEIKADFEQIQMSQDMIIKTYQGTGKINYEVIGKSAQEINSSAARLNLNLFPVTETKKTDEKKDEKAETQPKTAKSIRDLIVDLDNTIGSFATSPMFQNLRVVDAAVSAKAKLDLEKIMELSAEINTEAQKLTAGEK